MNKYFPLACIVAIATSGCIAEPDQPEEQDEIAVAEEAISSSYMGCYVDTFAYDLYEPYRCRSYGTAYKTVADFRIFSSGTPTSIVWPGQPKCNGSTWCAVPIQLYGSVTQSASYYVNGVFMTSTATAYYDTSN